MKLFLIINFFVMSNLKISDKLMNDLKSKNINLNFDKIKSKTSTPFIQSEKKNIQTKEIEKNQSFNSSESLEKTSTTINFKIRPCTPNPDAIEKKNDLTNIKSAKTTLTTFPNFKKEVVSLEKTELNFTIEEDEENCFNHEITEDHLCQLCNINSSDFPIVTKINLKVDLSYNSLQNLGFILPNLKELKLNGSKLLSLRDIGTSLVNLEILWASKCMLQDISGILMFQNLKELYISFNQIKDLTDIGFLENLLILDIEGNEIEPFNLEYLLFLKNLYSLNLLGNPIAKQKNYPQCIIDNLKNLQILDEKPLHYETKSKKKSEINIKNSCKEDPDQYLNEILKKFKKLYSELDLTEITSTTDIFFKHEMESELNDEDLILYSIKRSKTKKNNNNEIKEFKKKEKSRPQTCSVFRDNSSAKFDSGISNLVSSNDVAFFGNPLKIFKHKRKTDDNLKEEDKIYTKNLLNLIEEFRVEKSSEEIEDVDFDEEISEISKNGNSNDFVENEDYYDNDNENNNNTTQMTASTNIYEKNEKRYFGGISNDVKEPPQKLEMAIKGVSIIRSILLLLSFQEY